MTDFLPARGAPDDPVALRSAAPSESYRALYAHARGVALALGPGRDVLVLCEDRFWFAVALLGAWQAGRRVALPPHRGNHALEQLTAQSLVLHDGALLSAEQQLDVRTVPAALAQPPDAIAAERELITLYTSGSTGSPIAWVKRARQLLGEAEVLAQKLALTPEERLLPTVAPQHIYGLLFGLLVPLAAGASFLGETPLHAEAIFECARRARARWLVSVPAHLSVLTELLGTRLGDGGSSPAQDSWPVRSVVSSGAPLDAELARRLAGVGLDVIDVLGSTETGGLGLRRPAVEVAWTPLTGVQISVGSEERLVVRSPFLDDPSAAHVTGDRGSVDEQGRFRHLGRADDVVKIAGKRIALAELEAEVRNLDGVVDAALLKMQARGLRGEEIWLAVVAPGGSRSELRKALRARIDPVFVPRRIVLVSELPRDERGKLQRSRLLTLFEARALDTPVLKAAQAPKPSPFPELIQETLSASELTVAAQLVIPAAWHRFEGHFPGDPLVPAVAELCDLILPLLRSAWPELGAPTRARRLKFLAPLRPGARVRVTLERSSTKVSFELAELERPVARGTLWFRE